MPCRVAGESGAKCEGKSRPNTAAATIVPMMAWMRGIWPRPSPALVMSARGANSIHAAIPSAIWKAPIPALATPRGNSSARVGGRTAILRLIVRRSAYNAAEVATSPSAATTTATGPRMLTCSTASVSQGRPFSHADACSARHTAIERMSAAATRERSPNATVPRYRAKKHSPSHQRGEPARGDGQRNPGGDGEDNGAQRRDLRPHVERV